VNVVLFPLGDSPASEFYMPAFRNIVSSIFIGGVNNNSAIYGDERGSKSGASVSERAL
jgi:hypothetical protein